ncbi:MAG: hypothetical protein V5804_14770 [Mucilaginibacter sp.]|uniref:hypothetical protein n=1 Tax=Mucilaginibacter sp. TaxID=1882438 RepID=UPI0034E3D449
MEDLVFLTNRYKQLLNQILPASFTKPVRYNHCFNRIILDWLFQDVWYRHLDQSKTAISQLDKMQLQKMVERMEQWLQHPDLLFEDNQKSLAWRKNKNPATSR